VKDLIVLILSKLLYLSILAIVIIIMFIAALFFEAVKAVQKMFKLANEKIKIQNIS